mgnify:CR=1 FL=1
MQLLQQHLRLVARTKNRICAEYYFQFFNRSLIVTSGRHRSRVVESNVATFGRRFASSQIIAIVSPFIDVFWIILLANGDTLRANQLQRFHIRAAEPLEHPLVYRSVDGATVV